MGHRRQYRLVTRAGAEPFEAPKRLPLALQMVRGQPLAHHYWMGVDDLARPISAVVERAAHHAATVFLARRPGPRRRLGHRPRPARVAPVARAVGGLPHRCAAGYELERARADTKRALDVDAALIEATWRRLRAEVG